MSAKIYICTHVDFQCPVSNPLYEIADTRKLFETNECCGVDDLFFSELRTYHHLATEAKLPQYVGFCQYRKYYDFMDDVPDIERIISEHGCIATTPLTFRMSVYDQYAHCFYFGDMDVMKAILHEVSPVLYPSFEKMLRGNSLYIGNMFILRREDFLDAMSIVWACLNRYIEIIGKDIKARILEHPDLYLAKRGVAGTLEHQYRFGGSLGERIMSAYVMHNFKNPKKYSIRLTENKARPYRKLTI